MSVNLQFPLKAPTTWVSLLIVFFVIVITASYLGLVAYSIYLCDGSIFQNSGAIGVAAVLSGFALNRRISSRQLALSAFKASTAVSELMVSRRHNGSPKAVEEFEGAGGVLQETFEYFDRSQKKADLVLLAEVLLAVFFTVQWGFGNLLFSSCSEATF